MDGSSTWTICTLELELIETIVTSADESQIVTVDEYGIRRNRAIDSLFFAIPTAPKASLIQDEEFTVALDESRPTKYFTLIDGQVIKGSLLDSEDDDFIVCSLYSGSIIRGRGSIPLERLLSITDRAVREDPADQAEATETKLDAESDTITTMNGDVLVGFIESIGLSTSIATRRGVLEISSGQIRSINLANFPQQEEGIYISTNDDLHLRVSSFDFDFQHPLTVTVDAVSLGFDTDARDVWLLDPESPVGVHVVHPSLRVVSLTTIEPELVEPTGGRAWTPAPTVLGSLTDPILSSIDLHAPVRVVYSLPRGTTRFACKLVVPVNTWTDCIASVYSISYSGQRTELVVQQLNEEHPVELINAVLGSDTEKIEVRIDPGAFGPIQDRVLIEHPRILIETN